MRRCVTGAAGRRAGAGDGGGDGDARLRRAPPPPAARWLDDGGDAVPARPAARGARCATATACALERRRRHRGARGGRSRWSRSRPPTRRRAGAARLAPRQPARAGRRCWPTAACASATTTCSTRCCAGSGARVRARSAPFEPEGGAYATAHRRAGAHGHDRRRSAMTSRATAALCTAADLAVAGVPGRRLQLLARARVRGRGRAGRATRRACAAGSAASCAHGAGRIDAVLLARRLARRRRRGDDAGAGERGRSRRGVPRHAPSWRWRARQHGRGVRRACSPRWPASPAGGLPRWRDVDRTPRLRGRGRRRRARRAGDRRWTRPLLAYLQAFAANLVSAGVRLIPLGQSDGPARAGRAWSR